jgi:hypothetical protein
MREIALFVEDHAHQSFLDALISRLAKEWGIEIQLRWLNVRRGHGAVIRELKQFLRDLQRDQAGLPDLVVVATDANCKGMNERMKEISSETANIAADIIYAVPDPHIERWLLLDSGAFKTVFGRGCKAPDQKCERARYKKMLIEAILETGIIPSLGGIEFSEDIVQAMDIKRAIRNDPSFKRLVEELYAVFGKWQE